MKAKINRDGLLILSPDSPTEEYALRKFLDSNRVMAADHMEALPLDFIFVEDCDD